MTGTQPGDAARAHAAPSGAARSDAGSLLRRIEHGASGSGTITFLGSAAPDGVAERISWGHLHEDAQGVAAALQARGVAPGDHVAILGPTSRPLVTMIQATWLAGATVVCLPLPMRLGSLEEFAAQTRRRVLNANVRVVVVDAELEPFLALEPGDPPVVRLDEVRANASAWERPLDDPDALGILQFTSGSTDDPKGVMLPQRCLVANIDAILEGAGLGPDDVGVSWLPLYHDMGLIGLLTTPMITGFDLGLAPPQDFLAGPADWMRWISQMRATVTGGPNFAYALAARSLPRLSDLDLSPWRIALNGAEPIDPAAVEAFLDAGAARARSERRVLRVRHGRSDARDLVPRTRHRDDRRRGRSGGARARALRGAELRCPAHATAAVPRAHVARARAARVRPRHRLIARRARGRRARAARRR